MIAVHLLQKNVTNGKTLIALMETLSINKHSFCDKSLIYEILRMK